MLKYCREYREHVKDLSCISKDLCRTVIVDNNPFSFLLQPLNGIPCIPFSAGQPHDEQVFFANPKKKKLNFLVETLGLSYLSCLIFVSTLVSAFGSYPTTSEAPFAAEGC